MTVIGLTASNDEPSQVNGAYGVITPRTSKWKMSDIRFHNYPVGTTVIYTCSQCDFYRVFTNTANEILADGITFTNISGKYLFMQGHKKEIIYNTDGSLSQAFDGVARSSVTIVWGFPHLTPDPNCFAASTPTDWFDAIICDDTVKMRRVMFTNILPFEDFESVPMKAELLNSVSEWVAEDSTSFSEIVSWVSEQKEPKRHKKFAYALPYIAGRVYNIWWLTGLDFTHMAMEVSQYFVDEDPAVIFKFNYTENRELYEIGHFINSSVVGDYVTVTINATLDADTCEIGDYTHDNEEGQRSLTLCATNRGKLQDEEYLDVNGIRCRYLCPDETGEFEKEDFVRIWSNVSQWPEGRLPTDGENVTIPGPWTILMDVDPAEFEFWHIDGDVIIPATNTEVHIKAEGIWIKAGSLSTEKDSSLGYYPGTVTIELMGNKNDAGYVFTPDLAGNKIMVITGKLELYGKPPSTPWTKLKAFAYAGDTSITVQSAGGW